MPILTCPYCAIAAKTEFSTRDPGLLAEAFGMYRFRKGRFIDESVTAGVAH